MGDSILDYLLPLVPRYLRALEILYLSLWLTYFVMLNWNWGISFSRHYTLLHLPLVSWEGVPSVNLFGRPGGVLRTFHIELYTVERGIELVQVEFIVLNGSECYWSELGRNASEDRFMNSLWAFS